jgi:hypothetical protein
MRDQDALMIMNSPESFIAPLNTKQDERPRLPEIELPKIELPNLKPAKIMT